jgi:hypothetical protein
MQYRIPTATLPGTYADGEIITAEKLNLIVNVLRTGVNANFNDYLKIIAGDNQIYAAVTLEALQTIGESLGADDAGVYGLVLNGIEEDEDPNIQTLMIYQFDYDPEEETGEFVRVFGDTPISLIGILNNIAEQDANYTAIQSNASAGATHAAITSGANPHATTFANITSKPTTVAGYGITDAATLVGGTVPANQLPSYVDDVIEGVLVNTTSTGFTVSGVSITPEAGKIYVSTSGTEDGKTFRWTGSQFVVVSDTLAIGNTTTTAFRGDLGLNAYNWANNAFGWGNHANVGYLTNSSTRISDIQNFANNTANNVANINNTINGVSSNLSNLTNTVTTINGSYLTASSTTITNITNSVNAVNSNVSNLSNIVANKADTSALNSTNSNLSNLSNIVANKADTSALNSTNSNLANLSNIVANKVNTSTTIANIALTDNISAANLVANLPVATNTAQGVMSATDKTNLDALQALMEDNDGNNIVDKITDVLDVFENYPEGTNIVTALNGKLNANFANIANWDNAFSWGNHANAGYALNTAIVNAGNWNTAYSWGNHANAGYANGTNVSNWDTAFSWGNHANAGYLTTESDTLNTVANRGNTTNAITVNYVTSLQTTYNSTTDYGGVNKGVIGWSTQYGTLQLGLGNGGKVEMGQTEMYYGKATENIAKGQVVMFNGAQGDFIKLSLASPSVINNNPDYMLGLAPTNITNDTFGYVTKFGYIDELPTNGFTNGTILWFDSNTSNASGGYTGTKPVAPNAKIQLAAVVKASSNPSSENGRLLVRVATGSQLGGTDSNVELVNVANGEVLAYNGTANRWENKEVVSLGLNVALTNIQNNQYLAYNNGTWINRDLVVYGTVNSVGLNMPTGFTVTNSPVTNTGTLNVAFTSGYSLPATSTQDNWNAAYGWGNHQSVGYIVGLANGTVTSDNLALWNGTTGKLLKDSSVAISGVNTAITHTTLTNNPHAVTKTQVGLANVTDFAQVRKIASVTSGNIPTWSDTTGANLGVGYTVQTTLSSSTTAIPTAAAIINAGYGNVVGPSLTVTDGNIVAFNGTTGKLLKDTGVAITSVLTSETDPVYSASNAASITGTMITNWNTAYGWGNHANSGYALNTAISNATNWDTAFSWGNHANAGYLTNAVAANTYQAKGNYATLTGGKIDASVLPAIAITDTFVVTNEANMLALTAETGDIAIRTDVNKTFVLSASPATTLANWKEILTPADGVTSVDLAVPTGLQVSGNPITSTGTLNITYATGYAIPTTSVQTNWNSAFSHISLTNNPHAVTKTQVGLANVTDFAQVRKIASVTSGNIPTWSDTTGANLGVGYTVQTTLSSSTTAIPTAAAIINAGYGNVAGPSTTVTSGNIVTYSGTNGRLLATGLTVQTTLSSSTTAIPRADAVITAVNARATTATYNATIGAGSWSGSGPFTKEVTVTGMTATDNPIIDLELSAVTYANVPAVQADWGKIYRAVSGTNNLTFYATEALTVAMPFSAKVVR